MKTTFQPRTVGLLVTALLAAGLFLGCDGAPDAGQVEADNGKNFNVTVIDSCEYIWATSGYQGFMAHKGNCRFCTARRTPCR